MSAGKGSRLRPVKGDKYRQHWQEIFRKPTRVEAQPGEIVEGHRCLGRGGWQTVDHKDSNPRDGYES